MQLKDKVALVTGAGSGIGRATAIMFAKAGAKVGIISRTEDQLRDVAAEIDKATAPGTAFVALADVSDAAQLQNAIESVAKKFGRLDIVMANAGINGVWAPIDELTLDEWNKTIGINLTGTFATIKFAAPHLKKAGGGSIIVVASVNGTRIFSNTGATAYSTSKAGQVAMTQMLALELATSHIRVNVICPGAIDTEINDNTQQRDVDKVKIPVKISRPIPLSDKPGTSDQVAQLALFLASDASSHITGTPVWIDGAQSLLQG